MDLLERGRTWATMGLLAALMASQRAWTQAAEGTHYLEQEGGRAQPLLPVPQLGASEQEKRASLHNLQAPVNSRLCLFTKKKVAFGDTIFGA